MSKKKIENEEEFSPEVWQKAIHIADVYDLVLRFEDGNWFGHALEFPMVMSHGPTPDDCIKSTRDALAFAVATMLKAGELPPPAAREEARSEQIHIRVTATEKAVIESKAKSSGFRGVSDFVRIAAIER